MSTEIELLSALVSELHGIRQAVEALASVQAPAPNITRPMSDWANAREILENLGASVIAEDKSGPTRAEYQGRIYTRRSAHDEDGEKSDAIWFSATLSGTVKDGNVKWGRLVTFRNRKTDMLPNGAKSLKVAAPAQPAAPVKAASTPVQPAPPASIAQPAKPTKPAQPTTPPAPARRAWPGALVQLVIKSGVAKVGNEAAELLNKSKLSPKDPEDLVIRWLGKYRAALNDGQEQDQALFMADTVLPQANREGGGNGAR